MIRKVLCAAIHYDDGKKYEHQPKNISTGLVICGRRHHNCLLTISLFIPHRDKNKITQGFLTTDDNYVTRQEAFKIAKDANQIINGMENSIDSDTGLISEDLY